jgi:hypothetical protein
MIKLCWIMVSGYISFLLLRSINNEAIENLDDGKVIHLVVRPINAPHNPENGKKMA